MKTAYFDTTALSATQVVLIFFLILCRAFPVLATHPPLEQPLSIGPQFPLHQMYTLFEPDAATTLAPGKGAISTSFIQANIFNHSINSYIRLRERELWNSGEFKTCDRRAPPDEPNYNWNCKSDGYSILMDGEVSLRTFHFQIGVFPRVELQYHYKDIRLSGGQMDGVISGFHDHINNSDGSHWVDKNGFEFYVFDNQSKEFLFFANEPNATFKKLSEHISLKLDLMRAYRKNSLALKISANFNDDYFDRYLRSQYSSATEDFDDFNISLYHSYLSTKFSLHSAISISFLKKPVFEQTNKHLYFLFFCLNWRFHQQFALIVQDLNYSSIFPEDAREPEINYDLNELTLGLRIMATQDMLIEAGLVENVWRMGIPSVDFAWFFKIGYSF